MQVGTGVAVGRGTSVGVGVSVGAGVSVANATAEVGEVSGDAACEFPTISEPTTQAISTKPTTMP
jgi:hypothetical protein